MWLKDRAVRWALGIGLALAVQSVPAAGAPTGTLALTALVDGEWQLYYRRADNGWARLPAQGEPRTPAIGPAGQRIAYVTASNRIREVRLDDAEDRVALDRLPAHGVTQPAYGPEGGLFVVLLTGGASAETEIVEVRNGTWETVLAQRSAQLDPHLALVDGTTAMYYSNLLCTVACGDVIQEIWRFRPSSGRAEQITHLNGHSRHPFVREDGVLYFSSNAAGSYHIWRQTPDGDPQRITRGSANDSLPAVDGQGGLYYLRRSADGVDLMHRPPEADRAARVALPFDYANLKDLRISSWNE